MTTTPTPGADLSRLRLGTAPDSWGVWFPDDPHQVPWQRFLDEVVEGGYQLDRAGPLRLPADRSRAAAGRAGPARPPALRRGGLRRAAPRGGGLRAGGAGLPDRGGLLAALGARYLVLLPEQYTDMHSGDALEPGELDAGAVERPRDRHVPARQGPAGGVRHLAGLPPARRQPRRHPAPGRAVAAGHRPQQRLAVPRHRPHLLLRRRQPRDHPPVPRADRLRAPQAGGPCRRRRVREESLSFADAVKLGAMVEPPTAIPAMEPLLDELGTLDVDLFAIVEQDLYPCEPDCPFPVATRTRAYLNGCGLGPAPRRR